MKDTYLFNMLILIIVVLGVVNILLHINQTDNKFLLEQNRNLTKMFNGCAHKLNAENIKHQTKEQQLKILEVTP